MTTTVFLNATSRPSRLWSERQQIEARRTVARVYCGSCGVEVTGSYCPYCNGWEGEEPSQRTAPVREVLGEIRDLPSPALSDLSGLDPAVAAVDDLDSDLAAALRDRGWHVISVDGPVWKPGRCSYCLAEIGEAAACPHCGTPQP